MPPQYPRVNQEVVTSLIGEFLSFRRALCQLMRGKPGLRLTSCYKRTTQVWSEVPSHPRNHRHRKCQELDHHRSCPHFLTSSCCGALTRSLPCCSSKLSCRPPPPQRRPVAVQGKVLRSSGVWEDCIYGTGTNGFHFTEHAQKTPCSFNSSQDTTVCHVHEGFVLIGS